MRRENISEERRRQILEGALAVFAEKGFARATNRDIAAAAGINSPGLIYHYFADKADLLRAVIEQNAPPMQMIAHNEQFLTLPLEEALTVFGRAYLRLTQDAKIGACMRVLMAEAFHNPEFAGILGKAGPLRVWQLLADYLARQMEAGTLRRTDPALAARCFCGPLVLYMLGKNIFQMVEGTFGDPEDLVRTNVAIFLHGLQPEQAPIREKSRETGP